MKSLVSQIKAAVMGEKPQHEPEEPIKGDPSYTGSNPLLRQASALYFQDKALDAFKLLEGGASLAHGLHEYHLWRGKCLAKLARHREALAAFEQELAITPMHREARQLREQLKSVLGRENVRTDGGERNWRTALPRETLLSIQNALHNYTYRGVPMLKNPFDMALYPLLLWNVKPRSLIEIGSKSGGSALWFGDLLEAFDTHGHVYSLDIVPVKDVSHPRVSFAEADGRNLGATLTGEFLQAMPRPWLVIEDADHTYATSLAVLNFFSSWLHPGEYIVVEDGIISDLSENPDYISEPHQAIKEFLGMNPEFEIDAQYCDFFGYNLTWNTNGFLRKKLVSGQQQ